MEERVCPSWLALVMALEKLEKHHIAANIKAKYCNNHRLLYELTTLNYCCIFLNLFLHAIILRLYSKLTHFMVPIMLNFLM